LSIIDLPEINVKNFHPVRTNVIPQATPVVATTTVVNTIISNQTSMAIGVKNGCGCERHPRTTTESPPSDLRTRVVEYRKNMEMYRQKAEEATQRRKKKKKVPYKELDDTEEQYVDNNDTAPAQPEDKVAADPIEYLSMTIFLSKIPLLFFCIREVVCYHTAVMMITILRWSYMGGIQAG